MTATQTGRITLPVLALSIGKTPDWVRARFRADPKLAAFLDVVGPIKFISTQDLPAIKKLLGVPAV